MTTRLVTYTTDYAGNQFSLFIYDRDYVGEPITVFYCKKDSIILSHEGDKKDPFKRVVPTKLTWTMFLSLNTYTVDESDELQLFYDDLKSSYEGRFYCTLRQSTIGGKILFRGKIIPDVGTLILSHEREVSMTAVDGLSVLKDTDYRPDDYDDTVAAEAIRVYTFISHFQQILMKSDVNKFFYVDFPFNAVGDILFTTAANWTESHTGTGDIFKRVKKRNTYFEAISKSYRKYGNCYDALVDLLTGFNARIIFSDGIYHVEQLGYLDNPTLTRYKYDFEGNSDGYYGNKTLINITTDDDIQILKTPSQDQLVPFKAVELIQSKAFTNYLNGLKVSSDLNPGVHTFGDIISEGKKLVLQFMFDFYNKGAEPSLGGNKRTHKIVVKFQIKIGTYYLKLESDTNVTFDTSNFFAPVKSAEWTLTPSEVIFTFETDFYLGESGISYTDKIINFFQRLSNSFWVVESIEILEDGELTLELTDIIYTINTVSVALDASLRSSSRLLLGSGYNDLYEPHDEISIFEVGDIRNTVIYPLKFDYFDDAEQTFKQLFIDWDIIIFGVPTTVEVLTVEWTDSDMAETWPIQKLCMKQVLGMRAKPSEVLNFSLIKQDADPMTFDMRFAFNDLMYIPLSLEHSIETGEYKFSLYKVFKDYDGINIIDVGEPDLPAPDFPFPGSPVTAGFGGSSGGIQFYQQFENVVNNYVTLDFNLSDNVNLINEQEIYTKWAIFINGVKQRYLYDTLVNRTWKFDLDNDRIYFFKGSGPVEYIEVFKYK